MRRAPEASKSCRLSERCGPQADIDTIWPVANDLKATFRASRNFIVVLFATLGERRSPGPGS